MDGENVQNQDKGNGNYLLGFVTILVHDYS